MQQRGMIWLSCCAIVFQRKRQVVETIEVDMIFLLICQEGFIRGFQTLHFWVIFHKRYLFKISSCSPLLSLIRHEGILKFELGIKSKGNKV